MRFSSRWSFSRIAFCLVFTINRLLLGALCPGKVNIFRPFYGTGKDGRSLLLHLHHAGGEGCIAIRTVHGNPHRAGGQACHKLLMPRQNTQVSL